MGTDARLIAQARRCSLIAPAGFGKTHLIAQSVADHCKGRQLLLTHTHAGVRAMGSRLEAMGCSRARYHVETISGWALRYSTAYPALSGIDGQQPKGGADWRSVYRGAVRVLESRAIAQVVQRSYDGIFVDEYQDCTISQHAVILRLADLLPCRILGDPLQGIFGFEGDSIDWQSDVNGQFAPLDQLETPYRWQGRNAALGRWLTWVRRQLEEGKPLDLERRPAGVWWTQADPAAQRAVCYTRARDSGTIVAIHEGSRDAPCQFLARRLGGLFQCMEAVDCQELYQWAGKFDEASGRLKAALLIDIAGSCLTGVKSELATIRKRFREKAPPKGHIKKHLDVLRALEVVAGSSSASAAVAALDTIRRVPGAILFRRELWDALKKSLVEFEGGNYDSVADAAWKVRDLTRRVGRPAEKRTVSRTLLVKGLEFDHAIVLDADSLDYKQLYVAMTRGSRSLTILSKAPRLHPS